MNGVVPLVPLYAFMTWTMETLPLGVCDYVCMYIGLYQNAANLMVLLSY
jgi:hypothetical protein